MNNEDYAVVVGIRAYPGFGRTRTDANDLNGPDNDATAVHEWLVAQEKGGVPRENVKLIRSIDFAQPFATVTSAAPQKQAILDAFSDLVAKAEDNLAEGRQMRVGRRFYAYMSGHGFAMERRKGGLFVANATRLQPHHVFSSEWVNLFSCARYFDECVLWMDCCMSFDIPIVPDPPTHKLIRPSGETGKIFAAFAAKYPQRAVEDRMADDKWHGIFTYALLLGLNGDAIDPNTGNVTSESLKNYLFNHMKSFMSEAHLSQPDVSKEPDFGPDDPVVFWSPPDSRVTPMNFPIEILFPQSARGNAYRILTGAPPRIIAQGTVPAAPVQVQLPLGLYFVKMDTPALSHGFEVLGGGDGPIQIKFE